MLKNINEAFLRRTLVLKNSYELLAAIYEYLSLLADKPNHNPKVQECDARED